MPKKRRGLGHTVKKGTKHAAKGECVKPENAGKIEDPVSLIFSQNASVLFSGRFRQM